MNQISNQFLSIEQVTDQYLNKSQTVMLLKLILSVQTNLLLHLALQNIALPMLFMWRKQQVIFCKRWVMMNGP